MGCFRRVDYIHCASCCIMHGCDVNSKQFSKENTSKYRAFVWIREMVRARLERFDAIARRVIAPDPSSSSLESDSDREQNQVLTEVP